MRLALVGLIVISSMGLIGTAGTIGVVDYFAGDLPSIQAIQAANLTQTTRILDRNGTVIDGNAEKVTDVTDVWTFARDVTSRDPNWKVVATEAGQ